MVLRRGGLMSVTTALGKKKKNSRMDGWMDGRTLASLHKETHNRGLIHESIDGNGGTSLCELIAFKPLVSGTSITRFCSGSSFSSTDFWAVAFQVSRRRGSYCKKNSDERGPDVPL